MAGNISDASLQTWRTAAYYLTINGVGLAATHCRGVGRIGAWFICIGAAVFSGSLFLLVITGAESLGVSTPIGGFLLVAGWLITAVSFMRGTIDT
jgi:uncharacterized membrane protein YgdD (TMEM256/DUF423 family)